MEISVDSPLKIIVMKLIVFTAFAFTVLTAATCKNQKTPENCFKGKLEIKAICSNYTIKLLEGELDSRIEASWKDESTGKTYEDVFALGSPCSFPQTINEGDEFYFVLADADQNCAVCQAYYPKPAKSLAIKVVQRCD